MVLFNTYIPLLIVKYGKWVQKLDFDKSFENLGPNDARGFVC